MANIIIRNSKRQILLKRNLAFGDNLSRDWQFIKIAEMLTRVLRTHVYFKIMRYEDTNRNKFKIKQDKNNSFAQPVTVTVQL